MLKEGKICIDGQLSIKRGTKLKEQMCCSALPDEEGDYPECGDWCPLFGEPVFNVVGKDGKNKAAGLNICQNRCLEFEKFIDERGLFALQESKFCI